VVDPGRAPLSAWRDLAGGWGYVPILDTKEGYIASGSDEMRFVSCPGGFASYTVPLALVGSKLSAVLDSAELQRCFEP
jgi:hypothetical protein